MCVRYGYAVGRWTTLACAVGWPRREVPTLCRIVRAESGGNPRAYNPSGCAGLLQLSRYWYRVKWSFDPFNARANLRHGRMVWRLCGWDAWVTY